jgi:hypothetical protein
LQPTAAGAILSRRGHKSAAVQRWLKPRKRRFTALLERLDPQRFGRTVKPPQEPRHRPAEKSELHRELPPRPDASPRFAERRIVPLERCYMLAMRGSIRLTPIVSRRSGPAAGTGAISKALQEAAVA